MEIIIIVAATENNVIGRKGEMPWSLSSDLRYFKNMTWGMPVLMGTNTFKSFGHGKPLPGRFNLILSRNKDLAFDGTVVVNSLDDALFIVKEKNYKQLYIIGGGEIYKQLLPKVDKVLLTRVHKVVEDGDTFFPELDEKTWILESSQDFPKDEKNTDPYSFQVWKRK
jgi:dihydrofolate reductase